MLFKKIFLFSYLLIFVPSQLISMEGSCAFSDEKCEKCETKLILYFSDNRLYCNKCRKNENLTDEIKIHVIDRKKKVAFAKLVILMGGKKITSIDGNKNHKNS